MPQGTRPRRINYFSIAIGNDELCFSYKRLLAVWNKPRRLSAFGVQWKQLSEQWKEIRSW